MNDKANHIREQFSDQKKTIDLLMARDPEFLAMCEDYDACISALGYWTGSQEPEAETRVKEYRALVQDLRDEIGQALIRVNLK
ncbi:hypothetical protein JY97_04200 [Alkalispirochaeta odontotermitis]|nr:hypothetical protein JY97_04200 [Alkalispirochaeta odontotermitis]CAB1075310.1 hypothetical protein D1AOALGA4SA_3130 [Olavius algarvensis Delta 1 endosymbiont]